MVKNNKELIYKFLKKHKGKKFSLTELNIAIPTISRGTIFKWVEVLIAEKRIKVEDYGNVKLVYI